MAAFSRRSRIAVCLLALVPVVMLLPLPAEAQESDAVYAAASGMRQITFSGYTWQVKNSQNAVLGPGPNYFSDSPQNVWVDSSDRLHLRIEKRAGRWYSAEVNSTASFGYGTYRWYLDTPVDNLDPNVVLGMFTWNDDPTQNHRELDIEFARWGNATYANAQYTVQPYDVPGNQHTFNEPAGVAQSTHSLVWSPGSAAFTSVRGSGPTTDPGRQIASKTFSQGVPQPGGENARMNLWLFEGRAPTNQRAVEIVVKRFELVPAGQ